ncbi:MAG: FAD-dependent oxidoreductase, partial [Desulfovibrio sp.]|uniref:FAD-dependent oxidoreductase n=1 Tax=Desulfovibrio sp. TaxID=885 RepID=UPI0039E2E1A4
ADIAKEMLRALTKKGITCHEGTKAKNLMSIDGKARLELEDGSVITAAKALIAVGRFPNTKNLAADSLGGSLTARGYVQVDEKLQSAPGLYAIGDVNGLTLLAHAAEHQAAYVAKHILGETEDAYTPGPVPSCVYGSMEIMRVGKTASELLHQGKTVGISQAALSANPIAQASGGTSGFVKIVWLDGQIAGIAAVGHGVSHLVTVAQLLIKDGYTEARLDEVMFAHPTLDEIIPMAIRASKATAPRI